MKFYTAVEKSHQKWSDLLEQCEEERKKIFHEETEEYYKQKAIKILDEMYSRCPICRYYSQNDQQSCARCCLKSECDTLIEDIEGIRKELNTFQTIDLVSLEHIFGMIEDRINESLQLLEGLQKKSRGEE